MDFDFLQSSAAGAAAAAAAELAQLFQPPTKKPLVGVRLDSCFQPCPPEGGDRVLRPPAPEGWKGWCFFLSPVPSLRGPPPFPPLPRFAQGRGIRGCFFPCFRSIPKTLFLECFAF